MRLAHEYESDAVSVSPDITARDIADEMDAHAVGSVVVVDEDGRPLGIVTDRDLTLRVVATGRDPEKTRAEDVMSTDVLVVDRHTPTIELLQTLEERGVRRAPLVEDGRVTGLVSLDDLVLELGVQLWNVSEAAGSEIRENRRWASSRRRREAREEAVENIWNQLHEAGDKVRKRLVHQLKELVDKIDD